MFEAPEILFKIKVEVSSGIKWGWLEHPLLRAIGVINCVHFWKAQITERSRLGAPSACRHSRYRNSCHCFYRHSLHLAHVLWASGNWGGFPGSQPVLEGALRMLSMGDLWPWQKSSSFSSFSSFLFFLPVLSKVLILSEPFVQGSTVPGNRVGL